MELPIAADWDDFVSNDGGRCSGPHPRESVLSTGRRPIMTDGGFGYRECCGCNMDDVARHGDDVGSGWRACRSGVQRGKPQLRAGRYLAIHRDR
jgi:hypothetical protein